MSLGMVAGMEFKRQTQPFEPGDQLILSSDGIFPKSRRDQPDCLGWLKQHLAGQVLALETWDKLALAPARDDPSDDISTLFINWPV